MKLGSVLFEDRLRVVSDLGADQMLDLQGAARLTGQEDAIFTDMVSLIQSGAAGLDVARALMADAPNQSVLNAADVSFRCPFQPVQYRDCLVLETHLINSFAMA